MEETTEEFLAKLKAYQAGEMSIDLNEQPSVSEPHTFHGAWVIQEQEYRDRADAWLKENG
jgi:hypothetical protein